MVLFGVRAWFLPSMLIHDDYKKKEEEEEEAEKRKQHHKLEKQDNRLGSESDDMYTYTSTTTIGSNVQPERVIESDVRPESEVQITPATVLRSHSCTLPDNE